MGRAQTSPRPPRLPITRRDVDGEFVYTADGKRITAAAELDRIAALAIPPAWTDVRIARASASKVLAQGVDDAGRTQTIYSPAYRRRQEREKYARVLRFAERLPALRKQVAQDLRRRGLREEKVIACVVTLLDQQFFRIGNAEYSRKHRHYGLTTLRAKHASVESTRVTFDFIGKSGKRHVKVVKNPQVVGVIRQLLEMPGHEIFRFFDEDGIIHDLDSSRVNAYIKRHMGEEFSAKDFRTWGGTLLATSALLAEDGDVTDSDRLIKDVIHDVADRLGNTPAVTRSSYIDPRVFSAFEDGVTLPKVRRAMTRMRPRTYVTVQEQAVLRVLRRR